MDQLQIKNPNLLENVAQIIERSRHGDEAFFTDSKCAAFDILQYLIKIGLLNKPVIN